MERVLQLNSTDEHITYNSGWKRVSNTTEGQNGTHFLATDRGAEFFFMFRGIGHNQWSRYVLPTIMDIDAGVPSQVQVPDFMAV